MAVLGPTTGEDRGLYGFFLWQTLKSCLLCTWYRAGARNNQDQGTSGVQRRAGLRACSQSEWQQNQAASQLTVTMADLSAHEWHRM